MFRREGNSTNQEKREREKMRDETKEDKEQKRRKRTNESKTQTDRQRKRFHFPSRIQAILASAPKNPIGETVKESIKFDT